jgi:hypothetical protein
MSLIASSTVNDSVEAISFRRNQPESLVCGFIAGNLPCGFNNGRALRGA